MELHPSNTCQCISLKTTNQIKKLGPQLLGMRDNQYGWFCKISVSTNVVDQLSDIHFHHCWRVDVFVLWWRRQSLLAANSNHAGKFVQTVSGYLELHDFINHITVIWKKETAAWRQITMTLVVFEVVCLVLCYCNTMLWQCCIILYDQAPEWTWWMCLK